MKNNIKIISKLDKSQQNLLKHNFVLKDYQVVVNNTWIKLRRIFNVGIILEGL